ncbi:hypothetical protein V8C86DRAFT_2647323 [Haematococcus lacustris]
MRGWKQSKPAYEPIPNPPGSADADAKRPGSGPATKGSAKPGAALPQNQSLQLRQKDKFVPLPKALTEPAAEDSEDSSEATSSEAPSRRITVYCLSESLDTRLLETLLLTTYKPQAITRYPDCLQLALQEESALQTTQDAYFFEFGVIILFGLEPAAEQAVLTRFGAACQRKPYVLKEVEMDQFHFVYSATEPPHIKNDMFTINKRQANNHQVRLAIAYALAQSTKLRVYEERVWDLVSECRDLPEALAAHGRVHMTTKRVAQLIGKVFLQTANVNLLSSVLDTPPFFWSAPDHLQALYERACEYVELESRVAILNARFQVLQEMLDIVRSHQNNFHSARLEMIIIWLLLVDVILMLFQLLSLFGFIGRS